MAVKINADPLCQLLGIWGLDGPLNHDEGLAPSQHQHAKKGREHETEKNRKAGEAPESVGKTCDKTADSSGERNNLSSGTAYRGIPWTTQRSDHVGATSSDEGFGCSWKLDTPADCSIDRSFTFNLAQCPKPSSSSIRCSDCQVPQEASLPSFMYVQ